MSRPDRLQSYSNAVKDPAGGNPATAAAESDEFGGPAIRDNLYSGRAHNKMVRQLAEQKILEILPDDRIRITDPDRYLDFIERSYFEQAGSHLDPRMRAAIAEHIGAGGGSVDTVGVDPQGGGNSFGGRLPGTHAELIALNDILARGGTGPIDLATLRTTGDAVHFIACPHCRAIINILLERGSDQRVHRNVGAAAMSGFEEAAELLGRCAAEKTLPEIGDALHGLAADVRAMADGGEQADLGRHVDATVGRLEQSLGGIGQVAERDRERRQEEYRRSARSAIADALSEAGFTPLNELRGGE